MRIRAKLNKRDCRIGRILALEPADLPGIEVSPLGRESAASFNSRKSRSMTSAVRVTLTVSFSAMRSIVDENFVWGLPD